MNMTVFRSVEFWKASIMTLPDNAFFELLRTVFGKIKTPFNKQILMSDLEKFLLRKDNQKNIAGYINQNDVLVISAIAVLNEPTLEEAEAFFSGSFHYAQLLDLIVNLEERFILYRFSECGKNSLALNPVLKNILLPIIAEKNALFPSFAADSFSQPAAGQLDDRILAALFSFTAHYETFFKAGGGIRQKVLNCAQSIFKGFCIESLVKGMIALGLLKTGDIGEKLLPDFGRLSAFGSLGRRERMEYCASAIYYAGNQDASEKNGYSGISPWFLRTNIRACAVFIHKFIDALDNMRFYPIASLRRIAIVLQEKNEHFFSETLIQIMEQCGLLISDSKGRWQKSAIAAGSDCSVEKFSKKNGAEIVMVSSFNVMLYPEITYTDALGIAAISRPVEAGLNVRFEFNRDSAVMAFNRGITAQESIGLLQRLSRNRIDDNLIFSLRDWEKRYQEVSLRKGLVLFLSPERRYLAETRALAALITEIAPGLYFAPDDKEEIIAKALGKAGVSIIARQKDNSGNEEAPGMFPRLLTGISGSVKNRDILCEGNERKSNSASSLIDGFHSILNQMRLSAEERDELAARIDRRLILCESQLKDTLIRYEKLEARGLDYAGKALIARQAITMQALVEVIRPRNQKPERFFGIPKALEKTGGESVLVIEPIDGNAVRVPGDAIRIPLAKISMLRRVKKSIFEG